jgi:hypothetical protein
MVQAFGNKDYDKVSFMIKNASFRNINMVW